MPLHSSGGDEVMGDVRPDSVRLLPEAMKEIPVGTIRFRARVSRTLSAVALTPRLVLGTISVAPAAPPAAASPPAPVAGARALTP